MSVMTVDGRLVRRDQTLRCDAAIVGSGPGGATVARALAEAGADVIILEEGPRLRPGQRRPRVRSELIGEAVQRVKRAVRLLGEIMLAARRELHSAGSSWLARPGI